jgi:hypothetical protein
LIGWHQFWIVIECPASCSGFDIAVRAEASVATKVGPFSIGPKRWQWADRPRTGISVADPAQSNLTLD